MDSYASLLEKKQYDLLLKMTQDDTSLNGLFVRTRALIGLGKLEEALTHIETHQKEMEATRRALITIHLEVLLELEWYQQAFEALDYYDSSRCHVSISHVRFLVQTPNLSAALAENPDAGQSLLSSQTLTIYPTNWKQHCVLIVPFFSQFNTAKN